MKGAYKAYKKFMISAIGPVHEDQNLIVALTMEDDNDALDMMLHCVDNTVDDLWIERSFAVTNSN